MSLDCRNRLADDMYEYDTAGDIGCHGNEEIGEEERQRGRDGSVLDEGTVRAE